MMTEYFSYSGASRPAADNSVGTQRPASLTTIIGRIEEAVEAETTGLKDRLFDVQASYARKSRYLYELTRAMKGMGETDFASEHRDGILRLRDKLSRNEAAIRAHLNAVSEVAALMQDAIRNSEADGTYSAGAFGYGM